MRVNEALDASRRQVDDPEVQGGRCPRCMHGSSRSHFRSVPSQASAQILHAVARSIPCLLYPSRTSVP